MVAASLSATSLCLYPRVYHPCDQYSIVQYLETKQMSGLIWNRSKFEWHSKHIIIWCYKFYRHLCVLYSKALVVIHWQFQGNWQCTILWKVSAHNSNQWDKSQGVNFTCTLYNHTIHMLNIDHVSDKQTWPAANFLNRWPPLMLAGDRHQST